MRVIITPWVAGFCTWLLMLEPGGLQWRILARNHGKLSENAQQAAQAIGTMYFVKYMFV